MRLTFTFSVVLYPVITCKLILVLYQPTGIQTCWRSCTQSLYQRDGAGSVILTFSMITTITAWLVEWLACVFTNHKATASIPAISNIGFFFFLAGLGVKKVHPASRGEMHDYSTEKSYWPNDQGVWLRIILSRVRFPVFPPRNLFNSIWNGVLPASRGGLRSSGSQRKIFKLDKMLFTSLNLHYPVGDYEFY